MHRCLILLLLSACATTARVPGPLGAARGDRPTHHPKAERALNQHVADAAAHFLSHQTLGYRSDCSGFVEASYARIGHPITGSAAQFWQRADTAKATHFRRRPEPGDLAFFDNTHDRNQDGKLNDSLTHVAIVLGVDDEGTILLAHDGTRQGRGTLKMNLYKAEEHTDLTGQIINDYLRSRNEGDPRKTDYLSGALWRGFATSAALLNRPPRS